MKISLSIVYDLKEWKKILSWVIGYDVCDGCTCDNVYKCSLYILIMSGVMVVINKCTYVIVYKCSLQCIYPHTIFFLKRWSNLVIFNQVLVNSEQKHSWFVIITNFIYAQ